jgi:uncharacterized protein (DUF433 family)
MPALIDIGSLIARSPDIRGGRPRIVGTGVTVQRLVSWYKLGLSPEDIQREIPHLSLAHIYSALTYYHANQQEIETALAQDDAEAHQLEAAHAQLGVS